LGARFAGAAGAFVMRRIILANPSLFLVIVLLVLWQIVFWLVGRNALLPPLETILYLARLLQTERFWGHIAETGTAFVIALAIAVVAGLAIGVGLGMNRMAAEVFEPFLLAGNSVPKIALYPIVLLIFGIGMPAKIAFGAIHGVVPVAIFTLTACGNDLGFESIFERQIEALGRPHDIALGISTSGNSPNVLRGLRRARALGLQTLGLTGGTGGQMPALCDVSIVVPSTVTARIQEMHITICHMLCKALEQRLGLV